MSIETKSAPSKGSVLWHTAAAVILAPAAWAAVGLAVALLLSLWNRFVSDMRPDLIDFFSAVAGAWVGMMVARAACDKFLKTYAHRWAVTGFVIYEILSVMGIIGSMAAGEEIERPISTVAVVIVVAVSAYVYFWRKEDPWSL